MRYYIEVAFGANAATALSSLQLHDENMGVPATEKIKSASPSKS